MARRAFRIYGDYPELLGVPDAIKRLALPGILKEGKAIAQAEAPTLRGLSSSKSIASRITTGMEKDFAVGHIRARAPHSHLIEFGTRAHSLASGSGKSKKAKGKAMLIKGDPNIIRRGAWHPGSKANPFMHRTEEQLPPVVDKELLRAGNQALTASLRKVDDWLGD